MSQDVPTYRWSTSEFVRAWEAGAFDHRVELVDGEVWPVIIGTWHGRTTSAVHHLLPREGALITKATLPAGESLLDPDCRVLRPEARPRGKVGARLDTWAPEDVLLVVEVSDDTVLADLGPKARLYGEAGLAGYWVVTGDVVYEHTEPTPSGYRTRTEYRRGDRLPI